MKSLQLSTQCPVCDSGLDTKKARICGTNAANDTTLNNVLLSPNYAVAAPVKGSAKKPPFNRTFLDHRDRVELGSETGTMEQQQQNSADDIHTERFIINMLLLDSQLSLDSLKRIEETLRQKRVKVEARHFEICRGQGPNAVGGVLVKASCARVSDLAGLCQLEIVLPYHYAPFASDFELLDGWVVIGQRR
ncbi:hypothetical protein GPALN_014833 [Globodera pallida]|nr:hypothetical protein GPALN_014833 [Globodera pallida]